MDLYYYQMMECLALSPNISSSHIFSDNKLLLHQNITAGTTLNPLDPLMMNQSVTNSPAILDYSDFSASGTGMGENPTLLSVRNFLRKVVVPAICILGVVGNALTLLVLTRKRLTSSCDGTERTVHVGLFSLAISDLLCCICFFPHGFFGENRLSFASMNFQLLYQTYGHIFINTFILTSTWLTVTMATSRYLAICHPFRARHMIGLTGTRVSILLVFLVSVLFNIPRFFEYGIETIPCVDGHYQYARNAGYMQNNQVAKKVYVWLYFAIGIFTPLVALAFCNIALVRALRESTKLRRRYRVPAAHVDSNHRITSILVTIVVLYILFVSPAEILTFVSERVSATESQSLFHQLPTAVEITNVLQTINFACNFVLYFILNVHFRQAMQEIFYKVLHKFFRCREGKTGQRSLNRKQLYSQASISRNTMTSQTVV